MKPQDATIYASFETVDLAELAARQIKKNFPKIHSIAIRYRNNPPEEHARHEHAPLENASFLAAAAMGNGIGSGTPVSPVFFPFGVEPFRDGSRYEREDSPLGSTESRIVIKTESKNVNAIEAQLFNLGGVSVHASLRP